MARARWSVGWSARWPSGWLALAVVVCCNVITSLATSVERRIVSAKQVA